MDEEQLVELGMLPDEDDDGQVEERTPLRLGRKA